ncbi:hypothetical protein B0H16DRAFT_1033664 [Mycena metata]|uniref:F-box domain-containing protein n=1 Tax=Mycena metata TaxID=1033252 RepID=A0AAD7IGC3_9AGAR|nr:hypothetical protein B0H16DRAFT_1033664 [Mycena metata]
MMSTLCEHSSRWRSFSVWGNQWLPSIQVQGNLASLKKLAVQACSPDSRWIIQFQEAPRLLEVELHGVTRQWISLPWIQLTHLTFASASVSNLFEVIHSTPNLEVLVVFMLRYDHWDPPQINDATLRHLHTLKLDHVDGVLHLHHRDDAVIFDHLTLPALKNIHLTTWSDDDILRFHRLSTRSSFSLQSIRLVEMTPKAATACLRSLSSVEEVEIRPWMDSSDQALELNALIDLLRTDPEFVPSLRRLTLREWRAPVSPSLLAEIFTARCQWSQDESELATKKLVSFRLFFAPSVMRVDLLEELRDQLRPWSDAGLEIVIDSAT